MEQRKENVRVNEYYGNDYSRSYDAVIINGSKIVEEPKKGGDKNGK